MLVGGYRTYPILATGNRTSERDNLYTVVRVCGAFGVDVLERRYDKKSLLSISEPHFPSTESLINFPLTRPKKKISHLVLFEVLRAVLVLHCSYAIKENVS